MALRYINNQTEKMCLNAVNQNGYALRYVQNQTEELCLEALIQNPKSIQYINIQKYPEIYEKYVFMMK